MTVPATPARVGRPRSEQADRAILAAATAALVEEGFGGMSIEGVAARAGVGKATIYRRWPNKAQLVVDAISRRAQACAPVAESGSLRDDLREILAAIVSLMQAEGHLMGAVLSEQWRHPELAEAFRRTFLDERRSLVREIIRRGVERGDVPPGTDPELLGAFGPAYLWHRLAVTGEPLTDDLPDRIVAQLLPDPGR